ncbi:MAG: Alpha-ribazole phosphatase [Syntrophaceae bacterium PtaU1.Bin231]|nr:MAG: Alpha-ribazole phosphatase [Syntrophaceae bacterium PtaU1.Bin231]
MGTDLMLIRHGEIGDKYRGAFVGKMDIPLSPEGRRQAERLRTFLRPQPRPAVLSSPLQRCLETARIAVEPFGFPVEVEEDLREIDFGLWEGLSFEEIAAASADAVEGWAGFDRNFTFPEGERIGGFLDRIARIGGRLAALDAGGAVVFTHGGVIRALICHFLKLSPRNYLLFEVRFASATTIRLFERGGILTGLNIMSGVEREEIWPVSSS